MFALPNPIMNSKTHFHALFPQKLLQFFDIHLLGMENGSRKSRVNAGMGKQLREMLPIPRAAAGNDRHGNPCSKSVQHFQVKAALHAVGVDGVQHDLPSAVGHAFYRPIHSVQPGVLSSALRKHPELTIHTLYVHAQHHALIPVLFRRRADDAGVRNGAGIDADLIRAAFQDPVEVVQGPDAAADRQRDEDLGSGPPEDIRKQAPALGGSGDIVENQLVRAGIVIETGHLHWVGHIPEALEVGALDHPAILHV